MLANESGNAIGDAIAFVERAFDPVPADQHGRAQWKGAMDERLRRLAVKIAPSMSVEQGREWRNVMADALADLPAMIALTAAKRAIHKPMRFLNEVEAEVRVIAEEVVAERHLARSRLDNLRLPPAPVLALPPQDDGAPLSFDEIRKMSPTMRSLGVSTGAITQEQVDEVEAAERAQAA